MLSSPCVLSAAKDCQQFCPRIVSNVRVAVESSRTSVGHVFWAMHTPTRPHTQDGRRVPRLQDSSIWRTLRVSWRVWLWRRADILPTTAARAAGRTPLAQPRILGQPPRSDCACEDDPCIPRFCACRWSGDADSGVDGGRRPRVRRAEEQMCVPTALRTVEKWVSAWRLVSDRYGVQQHCDL